MKYLLIILLFVNTLLTAQDIIPSVTNILRYGDGKRNIGVLELPFVYTENLTDVRLSFPFNITTGFRLLYDNPPEIGERFQGLSRRFIEYNDNGLYLRAGNFSNLYGNGLAMNLFENRRLAYDTWMDGIKAEYTYSWIKTSIAAGKILFYDSVIVARKEVYDLGSVNIELEPYRNTKLGISYVTAEGILPGFLSNTNIKAEIPELYFSSTINNYSLLFNYSQKWTNVITSELSSIGNGYYAAFSYAGNGLGITFEYKNYQFDVRDPFERDDNTRPTRMLPFQNPPIVMKEHSFTLLTRALHDVDFNDETGFQLETFYLLNENTTITLNGSFASRHDPFILNETTFAFEKEKRNINWFPSNIKSLSPYIELFAEAEYFFGMTDAVRFAFVRRLKTYYNDFTPENSHEIRSTVIPVQIQYSISPTFSFVVQTENEWVFDNFSSGDQKYYNQLLTLSTSFFSVLTIASRMEFTTSDNDPGGKKDWFAGEISYRINSRNSASITFGRERGGQVCSNGVCTYIQPFSGIRFTLQTSI